MNVVDDWFRGTARKKMEEILLDEDSQIYQLPPPSAVKRIYEEHRSGRTTIIKSFLVSSCLRNGCGRTRNP